ncbi:MAG: FAD binding domain-containing protein [Anaerolineaceae bacterium]|nr:FAD binding domain-containing protein [Anaerolineaceae bacterium]
MTEKTMQYKRPTSMDEARALKQQFGDKAKLLFGGTFQPKLEEELEVLIDLQKAGLDVVEWNESGLQIGGLATLKSLEESLELQEFSEALSIEYGLNVRNTLSLTNLLAQTNGRSPVLCCLLGLNARVVLLNRNEEILLATYMEEKTQEDPVIQIRIPEVLNLAFESVARSPKDLPIVCVSVAKSGDGSVHVSVGGVCKLIPRFTLKNDDGQEEIKAILANAEDEWASAEYRQEVGAVLLSRALLKLHLEAGLQETK